MLERLPSDVARAHLLPVLLLATDGGIDARGVTALARASRWCCATFDARLVLALYRVRLLRHVDALAYRLLHHVGTFTVYIPLAPTDFVSFGIRLFDYPAAGEPRQQQADLTIGSPAYRHCSRVFTALPRGVAMVWWRSGARSIGATFPRGALHLVLLDALIAALAGADPDAACGATTCAAVVEYAIAAASGDPVDTHVVCVRYDGGTTPGTWRFVRPLRWVDATAAPMTSRLFTATCVASGIDKHYDIGKVSGVRAPHITAALAQEWRRGSDRYM